MSSESVKFALPKGRMQEGIFQLLKDAGISLRLGRRGYRPSLGLDGFDTKILKPQNVVEMLDAGSRDLGFAGADWVKEKSANLVELLDTRLDPVKIVAAAFPVYLENGHLPPGPSRVATEYVSIVDRWAKSNGHNLHIVRAYGATEVFPPEDADFIVDNTATGETLRANGLHIFETVMESSTRLFAHPKALDDANKREKIETLVLLLKSVLAARGRVMLEVNVGRDSMDRVIGIMRDLALGAPTISSLSDDSGFAVKVAAERQTLPSVIPQIKAAGGTGLVVTGLLQIVD